MSEPTIFLSPNGDDRSEAAGPATRLLVATIEGIAILGRADGKAPWTPRGRVLTDRRVGQLLYEPGSGRLFAGCHADGGLWASEDAGFTSWRQLEGGLTEPHLYALGAGRRADGSAVLMAGTSPAALFRSDDLGESWQEVTSLRAMPGRDKWTFPPPPHIPHVKNIAFHPSEPETVFVGIEQGGLFRSADGGGSWTELTGYARDSDLAYRDIHRLLINPADPDEFYLAAGEGLYRSTDAGATWAHVIRRGDAMSYPDFLQFDPVDNRTIFVAGAARSPGGWYKEGRADASVLRSSDGGATWTKLDSGLPEPMIPSFQALSRHVWPGGMTLVLGTATGEVYASDDRGDHWTTVATGLAPVAKDEHFMPFLGRRPGGTRTDDPAWEFKRAEPASQRAGNRKFHS